MESDYANKPHNPMRMAGGESIEFNNAVFMSERDHADRNYALGFLISKYKCFPEGSALQECMDFYFQGAERVRGAALLASSLAGCLEMSVATKQLAVAIPPFTSPHYPLLPPFTNPTREGTCSPRQHNLSHWQRTIEFEQTLLSLPRISYYPSSTSFLFSASPRRYLCHGRGVEMLSVEGRDVYRQETNAVDGYHYSRHGISDPLADTTMFTEVTSTNEI
uniref:glutaminase n=1 Tax=Timema cristinae TaxID=61476 RepID=A0A7R9DLB3_TIMCR|nr:unnamed protein product [Timema cristinae]